MPFIKKKTKQNNSTIPLNDVPCPYSLYTTLCSGSHLFDEVMSSDPLLLLQPGCCQAPSIQITSVTLSSRSGTSSVPHTHSDCKGSTQFQGTSPLTPVRPSKYCSESVTTNTAQLAQVKVTAPLSQQPRSFLLAPGSQAPFPGEPELLTPPFCSSGAVSGLLSCLASSQ